MESIFSEISTAVSGSSNIAHQADAGTIQIAVVETEIPQETHLEHPGTEGAQGTQCCFIYFNCICHLCNNFIKTKFKQFYSLKAIRNYLEISGMESAVTHDLPNSITDDSETEYINMDGQRLKVGKSIKFLLKMQSKNVTKELQIRK